MSDLQFGLGANVAIQDEYPTNAILNLQPVAEESNNRKSYKAYLNPKAYEVLGLKTEANNEIAFSTSKSDMRRVFLMNANNFDSKANIKVSKSGTYVNKNNFIVLKERFNAELSDELVLELAVTDRSYNGQPIFELKKFKATVEETPQEEV